MNSNTSTSTQSLGGTTNPWIQKTLIPQSAVSVDDSLPIAAIVCIGVGLYVLLMFLIFALIRCYCGKQCSNLRCVCGNTDDPCCSCMPFNEEEGCNPTLVKIITCSCINCDNCCKSDTKKIDWVSIIVCDRCFGPGGWCSNIRIERRKCSCPQSCENCDVECNLDCSMINCLCFTIYNGPQASARHSQRGGRQSQAGFQQSDSSNNNFYYNENGDPIKCPPLPSTGRSLISYPDSSRTMVSSISSGPGTERDGRNSQRRVSSSLEVQPDNPSSRSIRSTSKSAIAPQQDVQLFAPRNQANMNGVQPVSGKNLSSKKKLNETKVKNLSNSLKEDDGNTNTNAKRSTQTSVATDTDSDTKQRKLSSTEGRNSVRFSPDVTSTTQSALYSDKLNQSSANDMENSSRPNTSSSVASSNSLSATSEALLAQYQLMDAETLTPR